jgi:hypothetical protein
MPPPAWYAHPPKGMKIITSGAQGVRMFCHQSEYGCAILKGAAYNGKPLRCLVVARSDVPAALQRDIVNHEIAHCNGWRHPSAQ